MFVRKLCLPDFLYDTTLCVQAGVQWLLQTCGLSSFIKTFKNKTRISCSDKSLYIVLSPALLVFVL